MTKRYRSYRTHAVILRRRDYSDADRVLTIYTPGMGKQELIAKGIRKTTSRKAGHLELFTHATLQVAQARTWDIITEADTVENFRHLRTDLDNIGRASYVCELIDRFTEADDENQPLWDLMLLALRQLDILSAGRPVITEPATTGSITTESITAESITTEPTAINPTVLLRWFELHLLSLTGFQPQLFHCIGCGKTLEPVRNFLSLTDGGVYCPECGGRERDREIIEPDTLKVLRYLQSQPWPTVSALNVRQPILQRVENILHRYLLTILERRLKSTDFLQRLQQNMTR